MPTFELANSQGSRIVAIAHEEADAAGTPRLAFGFGNRSLRERRIIVEMGGVNKIGLL